MAEPVTPITTSMAPEPEQSTQSTASFESSRSESVVIVAVCVSAVGVCAVASLLAVAALLRLRRRKSNRSDQSLSQSMVEIKDLGVDGNLTVAERVFRATGATRIREVSVFAEGKNSISGAERFAGRWHGAKVSVTPILVSADRGENEASLISLFKEVSTIQSLNHPQILRFLGIAAGEDVKVRGRSADWRAERVFLCTEFAEATLSTALRTQSIPLSATDLLQYVVQACMGLCYLESEGIVHNNISSDAYLVQITGNGAERRVALLLSDFSSSSAEHYTRVSEISFRYSCPEQLLSGKTADNGKSDVWAFGTLGIEILSRGEVSYRWLTTNEEVVQAIKSGECPRQPEGDGCSNKLYSLMRTCWKITPGERPSFRSLEADLTALQDDQNDIGHSLGFGTPATLENPQRDTADSNDGPMIDNTSDANDGPIYNTSDANDGPIYNTSDANDGPIYNTADTISGGNHITTDAIDGTASEYAKTPVSVGAQPSLVKTLNAVSGDSKDIGKMTGKEVHKDGSKTEA